MSMPTYTMSSMATTSEVSQWEVPAKITQSKVVPGGDDEVLMKSMGRKQNIQDPFETQKESTSFHFITHLISFFFFYCNSFPFLFFFSFFLIVLWFSVFFQKIYIYLN